MRVPLGTQKIWADALDENSGSQHALHRGLQMADRGGRCGADRRAVVKIKPGA
jgi:hypothetical protein